MGSSGEQAGVKAPSHADFAMQLFDSGLFSDCTIYSGPRQWNLHRAVLAQRCHFFRACFANTFRESRSDKPGVVAEVVMQEDESEALGRMLQWLYTLEYPSLPNPTSKDTTEENSSQPETITLPNTFWTSELALFITADKYDLTTLTNQASASICHAASTWSWDLDTNNYKTPPPSNPNILENFTDMLEQLYTDLAGTSPSARSLQQDLLRCSAMTIASQSLQHTRLSDLVSNTPELAKDLVEALRRTVEMQSQTKTDGDRHPGRPGSRARRGSAISFSGPWSVYRSGSESDGSASGRSPTRASSRREGIAAKPYIPMNEDSDEE